jgi:ABC-type iron transport system FetAB ATPase subunit
MATWDNTLTLGQLVPGLSESLKNTKQAVLDANNLEQSAKNRIVTALNTKIAQIQSAINLTALLISNITSNLDTTGISVLRVGPSGVGYSALTNEIAAALDKPMLSGSGYYFGVLILGVGPDLTQAVGLQKKINAIFEIQ